MLAVIMQYLSLPTGFLFTFILPVAVYCINCRYVWFSIPLAVLVEGMIHWSEFCYYESRELMILFTLAQIAAMAMTILLIKAVFPKRK